MKWEYLLEVIEFTSVHHLEQQLNSYGKDGWEVCSVLECNVGSIRVMFKKIKDE